MKLFYFVVQSEADRAIEVFTQRRRTDRARKKAIKQVGADNVGSRIDCEFKNTRDGIMQAFVTGAYHGSDINLVFINGELQ